MYADITDNVCTIEPSIDYHKIIICIPGAVGQLVHTRPAEWQAVLVPPKQSCSTKERS
jgi:hypothetical protein